MDAIDRNADQRADAAKGAAVAFFAIASVGMISLSGALLLALFG